MNIVNVGDGSPNFFGLAVNLPRLFLTAACPGLPGLLRIACTRLGIKLVDIPYQLVTHYHPDHAGLTEELKRLGVRLVVIDTQLHGVPLLSTYVKPEDNYTEISLVGSIVLSTTESRAFLEGIGVQG